MDVSCQVWFHLVLQFQKSYVFFESANQNQDFPMSAMFVDGSELNEQSLLKALFRSLVPFGLAVSEEMHFL